MVKLTAQQFETLKRRENPEVYTTDQMNQWIESAKETLIKAEVDELNEIEKAEVDLFNEEFRSFIKVTVISSPEKDELSKGLKYTDYFIREQQVDWTEVDNIIKSEDGGEDQIEKSREGTYTNTALNQKLGRVGGKYGQHSSKEGDDGDFKRQQQKESGDTIHHADGTKEVVHSHKEMMDKLRKPEKKVDEGEKKEDKVEDGYFKTKLDNYKEFKELFGDKAWNRFDSMKWNKVRDQKTGKWFEVTSGNEKGTFRVKYSDLNED